MGIFICVFKFWQNVVPGKIQHECWQFQCFQLIFTYNNGFRVNLIESDIRFLVYKKFKELNIQIPFPQRVVHIEK